MKVFVFADTNWSVGRVHRDVAKNLPDIEFTFENWCNYDWETAVRKFNEADVCLTNIVCIKFFKTCFPQFDFKKCVFQSHGFEDNVATDISTMSAEWVYGTTSESIRHMFPQDVKLFLMPNGVEHTEFDYVERDGSLNTLGWCGAPNVWYKQPAWTTEISKKTGIQLRITSGVPCEDDFAKWTPLNYEEIRKWYSTIDLLLITSIPSPKHETGPLPAFEAIMSGIPVVGTAVGNFENVPGPKFTSVDEAVEIINDLKSNPEKMKELAKEQYEYVMKNFTYASFADKWREAFQYVYSQNEHT
jgi:hypothetical protein